MKYTFTNPYPTAAEKLSNDITWVGSNFLFQSTDRFQDHSQYFRADVAAKHLKPVLLAAIARLDEAEKLEAEHNKK